MWQKTPEELRQALTAPFPNGDIEWRVSATNKEKTKGLAVPYVTNRAIQNRLDDTVGIDGWHNEFKPWKDGKAQLCGISIYFHERKQWLTKWDGADDSDIESVKGGLSDSMKRAAVEWGIGRYLYGMTQVWVSIEQRGKGFVIVDAERQKLDQTHEKWVQKLQNKTAVPPQNANQEQQQKPRPAQTLREPVRRDSSGRPSRRRSRLLPRRKQRGTVPSPNPSPIPRQRPPAFRRVCIWYAARCSSLRSTAAPGPAYSFRIARVKCSRRIPMARTLISRPASFFTT